MFGLGLTDSEDPRSGCATSRHGSCAKAGAGRRRQRSDAETATMFPFRATALLAPVLTLAALAPAASGAAVPSFGLKALGAPKGYFVVSAAPGSVVRERVRVVNAGRVAGVALLRAADAQTGRTTGAVYETKRLHATGTWLALDRDRVTLRPGESTVVGITVRVPAGAEVGDHLGGIVAQPEAESAAAAANGAKHSFRVKVVEQSIVAVQVVVPGPARQELKLTSVAAGGDPGFQTLRIGIANPGRRLVKGSGVVKVLDGNGNTLRRQSFPVDTFVPGTEVEDPVVVRGKILPQGRYNASVIIRWAGGRSTTLHAPFTVSDGQLKQVYGSKGLPNLQGAGRGQGGGPSIALLGGGALILLLGGVGGTALYFRRRTRELAARFSPPEADGAAVRVEDHRTPPAPDTVAASAEERD